jgi:thiol-disulfide isomerase/thioredoxin
MALIKLDNDLDKFINLICKNEECPDLIICYFTATWCGPCKQISPVVDNIAENNEHIRVIKVDVDECEDVSEYCKIDCMPTFKFYKSNNIDPVHSFSGADNNELINTIQLLLKTDEPNDNYDKLNNNVQDF